MVDLPVNKVRSAAMLTAARTICDGDDRAAMGNLLVAAAAIAAGNNIAHEAVIKILTTALNGMENVRARLES